MEKFDSLGDDKLAEFKSNQDAITAVEVGLAAGKAGVTKVYSVSTSRQGRGRASES